MSNQSTNTLSLGTDNIGKLLFTYAVPAIIAMASASLYNIIDSIFVGHGVGGAAIAGMAITMPIMNIAAAFGAMVGVGAGARISIRLGEGNKLAAEKTLGNAVMLNCIIGATIMVLMLVFLDPILLFFSGGKASTETIGYSRDFMQIIICGNIITHLYLGMNDMIRATGYPRKAMMIMLTAVAVNLCLNPLFIFKFGWGIRGSATATVIAQFVAFLIAFSHFNSKKSFIHFRRGIFSLDHKIIFAIISIGLAPFLVNICACMVSAFVNNSLLEYGGTGLNDVVKGAGVGDIYVGAYGIINRVALLAVMILQGLNQGMQPIVGYNYGAKQYDRVRLALFTTIGIGVTISVSTFLACHFMPDAIAGLFVDGNKGETEKDMLLAAAAGLKIAMASFIVVGFQVVATNFFQYIGKAQLAICTSMTRQMLFLLPLIWLFSPMWGANGVWTAMPLADLASATLAFCLLVHVLRKLR